MILLSLLTLISYVHIHTSHITKMKLHCINQISIINTQTAFYIRTKSNKKQIKPKQLNKCREEKDGVYGCDLTPYFDRNSASGDLVTPTYLLR